MNPNLHFEVSFRDPSKTGIYLLENLEGQTAKSFICGMETHFQPEFSIREDAMERVPDPRNPGQWKDVCVFTAEIRGWRTVLARLLAKGIITEPQIEKHFQVSAGRSSRNWQVATT